jgi:hypothetical protein
MALAALACYILLVVDDSRVYAAPEPRPSYAENAFGASVENPSARESQAEPVVFSLQQPEEIKRQDGNWEWGKASGSQGIWSAIEKFREELATADFKPKAREDMMGSKAPYGMLFDRAAESRWHQGTLNSYEFSDAVNAKFGVVNESGGQKRSEAEMKDVLDNAETAWKGAVLNGYVGEGYASQFLPKGPLKPGAAGSKPTKEGMKEYVEPVDYVQPAQKGIVLSGYVDAGYTSKSMAMDPVEPFYKRGVNAPVEPPKEEKRRIDRVASWNFRYLLNDADKSTEEEWAALFVRYLETPGPGFDADTSRMERYMEAWKSRMESEVKAFSEGRLPSDNP